MTKKIECPKCGAEAYDNFTVWMKGQVGYTVFFDGNNIEADDEKCYEMGLVVISCQCGYESEDQSDFIVEVRE